MTFTSGKSMFDAFRKIETEANEAPARPAKQNETEDESAAAPLVVPPVLRCSDCRVSMFQNYYALSERPVCAKCRLPYAKKLAFGRGPTAMKRALLWGSGAALGCALFFGIVDMTFPYLRNLLSFGIAFAITKAVMAANGNLGGRPFQYMTIALTYFAIGLGSVLPVAISLDDKSVIAAVEAQRVYDAQLRGSTTIGTSTELTGEKDAGADLVLDARQDIVTIAEDLEKQINARQALAKIHIGMSAPQKTAQQLVAGGPGAILPGLAVILFLSPFVGLLSFGVFSGGVGLLLLGYSLYKAWRWTDVQVYWQLSGPFRVGSGPIPTLY